MYDFVTVLMFTSFISPQANWDVHRVLRSSLTEHECTQLVLGASSKVNTEYGFTFDPFVYNDPTVGGIVVTFSCENKEPKVPIPRPNPYF